jgi:hypothetical protein
MTRNLSQFTPPSVYSYEQLKFEEVLLSCSSEEDLRRKITIHAKGKKRSNIGLFIDLNLFKPMIEQKFPDFFKKQSN